MPISRTAAPKALPLSVQRIASLADSLNVFNLVQTIHQQASLMRRQFFKFCRHHLECFSFHRSTYLIDCYGDSIDHYLTVT